MEFLCICMIEIRRRKKSQNMHDSKWSKSARSNVQKKKIVSIEVNVLSQMCLNQRNRQVLRQTRTFPWKRSHSLLLWLYGKFITLRLSNIFQVQSNRMTDRRKNKNCQLYCLVELDENGTKQSLTTYEKHTHTHTRK